MKIAKSILYIQSMTWERWRYCLSGLALLASLAATGCAQQTSPSVHLQPAQGQGASVICDFSRQPVHQLIHTDAHNLPEHVNGGFILRLADHRQITLPAGPVEWAPGEELTLMAYPGGQSISYQKIEDEAFSREQHVGISMPELYRKVYGLVPLQAGDDERYHISGVRRMLGITCDAPNFHQYALNGGDTAIVQYLDGRYWVLVFLHDDAKKVYNLEFRNFNEPEMMDVLKTWSVRSSL